ncbi:3-methyl-2-oxobutanoate hydroxymethyltransferase [bacterium]|nr:3-methyl-2-oxobutanoate hydroxymethyltransferase [bacterium]
MEEIEEQSRISPKDLMSYKESGRLIRMLSVPDYYSAKMADQQGIEVIMVGDSLGKHIHGDEDVFSITIGDMAYYSKIIGRAVSKSCFITDLPFSSYSKGPEDAVKNAKFLMDYASVQGVKLEGAKDYFPCIEALVNAGVPVMGHLNLKDTFLNKFGGIPMMEHQKNKDWNMIISYAKKMEKLGIFSLMLECVPAELGKMVVESVNIPVISQGAGHFCDGQCLVFHDMMGFHEGFVPKFTKRYGRLSQVMGSSVKSFVDDVHSHRFPIEEHEY